MYKPPYEITSLILKLIQQIAKELGFLQGAKIKTLPLYLRKKNKIKTIQSSLAIEGNSLSIDQMTALLEGKRIIAPEKDITEVQNAIRAYNIIKQYNPLFAKQTDTIFLGTNKHLKNNAVVEMYWDTNKGLVGYKNNDGHVYKVVDR